VDCLAPGGFLFLSVPNFRGIAGWFQKIADPDNSRAHNLPCMHPEVLARLATGHGLPEIRVDYAGEPHLWMDHPEKLPAWVRTLVPWISAILRRLPWRGRWLSPYIMLTATNPRTNP